MVTLGSTVCNVDVPVDVVCAMLLTRCTTPFEEQGQPACLCLSSCLVKIRKCGDKGSFLVPVSESPFFASYVGQTTSPPNQFRTTEEPNVQPCSKFEENEASLFVLICFALSLHFTGQMFCLPSKSELSFCFLQYEPTWEDGNLQELIDIDENKVRRQSVLCAFHFGKKMSGCGRNESAFACSKVFQCCFMVSHEHKTSDFSPETETSVTPSLWSVN